jgi:hypothetical protein
MVLGAATGCANISYPTRIGAPGYGSNRTPEEDRVYRLEKEVNKERERQDDLRKDIAKLEHKLNIR